jgi:hypothetical protein
MPEIFARPQPSLIPTALSEVSGAHDVDPDRIRPQHS